MKQSLIPILTVTEALHLMERYFEAETSEAEERALRRFVTSPEGAAPRFDELRAVMGLAAVGRRLAKQRKPLPAPTAVRPVRRRAFVVRWSAAAILCIALGASLSVYHFRQSNQCVAYIHGKKTTDSQQVLAAMHGSLADVGAPTETPSVEAQLNDIFQTIE